MNAKDLFSHNKNISSKNIRQNSRIDPTMKIILSDKKIAKALDQKTEQREFHEYLREKAKDGKVTRDDMREILGGLASGTAKSRTISQKEAKAVAEEIFPDSSRRYKFEKPKTEKNKSEIPPKTDKQPVLPQVEKISLTSRIAKTSPDYFFYRKKADAGPHDPQEPEEKKSSFFDAIKSVKRHRQN